MTIKMTGSFGPVTGAMTLGDQPPPPPTGIPTYFGTAHSANYQVSGVDNLNVEFYYAGSPYGWGYGQTAHGISTGKAYWEYTYHTAFGATIEPMFGILGTSAAIPSTSAGAWVNIGQAMWRGDTGSKIVLGVEVGYAASFGGPTTLQFALDMDNGNFFAGKDGTWNGTTSGAISSGSSTGAITTGLTGSKSPAYGNHINVTRWSMTANFGATPYTYTPPAGFDNITYTPV